MTIRFTSEAENDLEEIEAYTVQAWGEKQAVSYLTELAIGIDSLSRYPLKGKMPDARKEYRRIHLSHHYVFYRVDMRIQEVIIIRILHERSDYLAYLP